MAKPLSSRLLGNRVDFLLQRAPGIVVVLLRSGNINALHEPFS
jgi:hypothetical protein